MFRNKIKLSSYTSAVNITTNKSDFSLFYINAYRGATDEYNLIKNVIFFNCT